MVNKYFLLFLKKRKKNFQCVIYAQNKIEIMSRIFTCAVLEAAKTAFIC